MILNHQNHPSNHQILQVALQAEAKYAILAAVSHPQYKLKWVSPDNRIEVSQAFVEAVAMMDSASTTVAESTSRQSADSWPGR